MAVATLVTSILALLLALVGCVAAGIAVAAWHRVEVGRARLEERVGVLQEAVRMLNEAATAMSQHLDVLDREALRVSVEEPHPED